MAWPNTPIRTMTDGTSAWDAALGNLLQSGVNNISVGQASLAGVVADTIGGVSKAARTTTSALFRAEDGAGNARSLTDYLGYRTGPVIETVDSLLGLAPKSGAQTAAVLGGLAGWLLYSTTNGRTLQSSFGIPGGFYAVQLQSGRSSSDYISLYTPTRLYNMYSNVATPLFDKAVTVIEWGFTSIAAFTQGDWFMGIQGTTDGSNASDPTSTTFYYKAGIRYAPNSRSDASISLVTSGGTADTVVPTGASMPTSGAGLMRVRLEIHRSGTPFGATVRLFLNGLLFTSTTNLPISTSAPLDFMFRVFMKSTGTVAAAAELDIAYFKHFTMPYGTLAAGALSSDV